MKLIILSILAIPLAFIRIILKLGYFLWIEWEEARDLICEVILKNY